jgi:hypothetical protein
MNPGIEAVRKLAQMGYRPHLEGRSIRLRYEGQGAPDPAQVVPLVDLVRQHKDEVRYFLKSYCPRCGGCCSVPDYEGRPLCLGCDWDKLCDLYPGLTGAKH